MRWVDVRIKNKLFVAIAVPVLVVMAGSLLAWTASNAALESARAVSSDRLSVSQQVNTMRMDVIQIQQWLTDISATRGLDGLDDGFEKAEQHFQSYLASLASLRLRFGRQENKDMLARLDQLERKARVYYEAGKTMAREYVEQGPAAGNRHMPAFDKAAEALNHELKPFAEEQDIQVIAEIAVIADNIKSLQYTGAISMLLILVAVLITGYVLEYSVAKPILHTLDYVKELTKGDLTATFDYEADDEVGQLLANLENMADQLAGIIGAIQAGSREVSRISASIAVDAEGLSERTELQAASLEETAASMEQMTGTVRHNAESAENAESLAQENHERALRGGIVAKEAIGAMEDISDASKRIEAIISTIDGIAFQTNLLSLNAAVEAARAGDQGRGFAVVAAEVRQLALRSSEAAKEIKQLITNSTQLTEDGVLLVGQSGEMLKDIMKTAESVNQFVTEVASASRQQAEGIEQVNNSIVQMDIMTQENAKVVKSTVSASNNLAKQSRHLSDLINYFKTTREEGISGSTASNDDAGPDALKNNSRRAANH